MYIKPLNIYCEVCEGNIKKSNMESMELFVVILWQKTLRRSNVVNVEDIRCWKYSVEKLLVMDALLIGKMGRE